MKIMRSLRQKFSLVLLFVPAMLLLPGCMGDKCCSKDKPAAGPTVVSFGSEVVITTKSFENEFDQLLEENPHLKSVLALMPDAKQNFLKGMVNQAVVDKWVSTNKVDQKETYQKELDRMMVSVKRMLNTKYFGLEHPVQISDAEITDFYEKNKDTMPDLVVLRGGVKAAGVSFEKESDAKAFVAKVREVKSIAKAADISRLTKNYRDFKLVNSQSLGMDAALRDQVAAIATVPSVEVMKVNDKSFWVVSATAKEATQYRPFEQVKSGLEQYVAKEKRMSMFDTEITKLKNDFQVVVNDSALNPAESTQVAEGQSAPERTEEVAAAQPAQQPAQAA